MNLNDDVLNLILSFTQNPECVLVCKKWYNIIIKNAKLCSKCNKITKMYDYDIWQTDDDDLVCHMHALHKDTYKILDVEITNILPLKNLFEKMIKLMPKMSAFIHFTTNIYNHIAIYTIEKRHEFIDETSSVKFFNDFIGKKKNIVVEINVFELYNFINTFDNNEIFLFSINNKNNLEIKIKNSIDKFTATPVIDPINSCFVDCTFEIEQHDFIMACYNIKDDTENVEVRCYNNKIIFSSKETNKESVHELVNNSVNDYREGITSINRNGAKFNDCDIICGSFKLRNILKNDIENLKMSKFETITSIKFVMLHNTALAITYLNYGGQNKFHLL